MKSTRKKSATKKIEKKEKQSMQRLKRNAKKVSMLKKKYHVKLSPRWFRKALVVELEHGSRFGSATNISGDDLETTTKIVKAHLAELPDYYQRLEKMENEAKMENQAKKKKK